MSNGTPTAQPEYGGQCAFAVSLGKTDEPESGKHQLAQDGRVFYFKNAVAKFLFKTLKRSGAADQKWAEQQS